MKERMEFKMTPKIKICGLTNPAEASYLLEEKVEFAGIVLFYEKSKRNNSIDNARRILEVLHKGDIKTVAVTVSPTKEQVIEIEKLGFHYIQVHGFLSKEVFETVNIPIIKAIQVTDEPLDEAPYHCSNIAGYLYDGKNSGSGETFDWTLLKNSRKDEKILFLAGGLTPDNCREAIEKIHPDVLDVSSGVEFDNETVGKNPVKIKEFVRMVRIVE
ncbi:MAG TPA: phosphoribosylanthranilate isomerase [Lachnospiraceae bacterium]|nr:phosphoribosylanthranilate isomerase [Lachnospiraceae bacterium]